MALVKIRVCASCWRLTVKHIFLPYNKGSGKVGLACRKCGAWIGAIALDDLSPDQRAWVICNCDEFIKNPQSEDDDDG